MPRWKREIIISGIITADTELLIISLSKPATFSAVFINGKFSLELKALLQI